MFEGKAFKIEVIDKTETEKPADARPVKDDVKELIIYAVKALAMLIVVGGIVSTISAILVSHLS